MDHSEDIRTRFAWMIVQVSELEIEGKFERAREVLREFAARYAAEDAEGWLLNAVPFHEGSILGRRAI